MSVVSNKSEECHFPGAFNNKNLFSQVQWRVHIQDDFATPPFLQEYFLIFSSSANSWLYSKRPYLFYFFLYLYFETIFVFLIVQQMDSDIKNESEIQSTNDFIQTSPDVLQNEGNIKAILRRVVAAWRALKNYVSSHKSQVYLIMTVFAILYGFVSNNFYKRLICNYEKDEECMRQVLAPQSNKMAAYGFFLLTDCLILAFFIYSFIFQKTYRILTALGILQHILLFYTGQFAMSAHNMTGMIKAAHFPLFLMSTALCLIAFSFKICFKKSVKYTLAGFFLFCIFFYLVVIRNQCYYWKKGINGEIQDREGSCKLKAPLCIYLQVVSRFDLNFFFHNCFKGEQYRQNFDKHFSFDLNNGTIVGFSGLNELPEYKTSHAYASNSVFEQARRYKTLGEARKTKKHDVILDTVQQKYYIDVIYNSTLAQEKAEIRRKYETSASPPLVKNVLLIFLDAVSRFQTHTKLPKFVEWFEKQAKYKSYSLNEQLSPHISEVKAQAYEFYKYHALGYTTLHNLYPMFYGHHLSEMHYLQESTKDFANFSKFASIHKDYNERGFVTSFSSSFCSSYGADIYGDDLDVLINPKADHQSFSFNCDPNFNEPAFQFGYTKGNSASTDRCLYGKTQAEYAFEYTMDFFDKYKNSPKFSQINLIEGHDFLGGSVRFVDKVVTSFLQQLQTKGHLKDTLVIALSDHGQHQVRLNIIISDHYNPFLYVAVPQEMNRKYRDRIRLNQQSLVTPFNVYHLLNHVVLGESYPNKKLGLMGDLSFQTDCTSAKITYYQQPCFCQ